MKEQLFTPSEIPTLESANATLESLLQRQNERLQRIDMWAANHNTLIHPFKRTLLTSMPLSNNDAVAVWVVSQSADLEKSQQAREYLVLSNLRLMSHFAKRFGSNVITEDDIFQEGIIATMQVIDKFDPTRKSFDHYLAYRLKLHLRRLAQVNRHLLHLPSGVIQKINSMRRVEEELMQVFGTLPIDSQQVADVMSERYKQTFVAEDVEDLRWWAILKDVDSIDGTDTPWEEETQETMNIRDESVDVEAEAISEIRNEELRNLIKRRMTLPYRRILELRFGLGEEVEHSLDGVGKIVGISGERVRQKLIYILALMRFYKGDELRNLND